MWNVLSILRHVPQGDIHLFARLKLGQGYVFEFLNMTQYPYPIHLHGMSLEALASNRRAIVPYLIDTSLLGRNEQARVALVADNPDT